MTEHKVQRAGSRERREKGKERSRESEGTMKNADPVGLNLTALSSQVKGKNQEVDALLHCPHQLLEETNRGPTSFLVT
jgi:hypothetical protein